MVFLKPFFKTILLATLAFLVIVILGMKYHWVSLVYNQGAEKQEVITINRPSNKVTSTALNTENINSAQLNRAANVQSSIFEPILIDEATEFHALKNMTKAQLTNECKQLFFKIYNNSSSKTLFVGNCVVSNFHEVFLESPVVDIIDIKQAELQKANAEKTCRSQQRNQQDLSSLETELLIGICVSNLI